MGIGVLPICESKKFLASELQKTKFGNGELDDGKQIEHFRKRSFIKFYQPRCGCVDTGKNLFVL